MSRVDVIMLYLELDQLDIRPETLCLAPKIKFHDIRELTFDRALNLSRGPVQRNSE